MKVILKENVAKLGKKGEIKKVSDGYARNYLFPRDLAEEATASAMKHLKSIQSVQNEHEEKERKKNEEKLDKLMKEFFVIKVKAGEKGKLFGSITNADIAKELSQYLDEKVEKKHIILEGHLKEVGTYDVGVKFPGGVKGTLKVKLEPFEE